MSLLSKQHISPGDTSADQPLPQDLAMSSHSLFPRFFIHSFFIHPGTFPFMSWLSLKAFGERCCLQLSGNKTWLYQQDILYPKACWHLQRTPMGPYGRTSLYKSRADSSTAHHIYPCVHKFGVFFLVATKQQYNSNLLLASDAAGRAETSHSSERLGWRRSHWICIFQTAAFMCRKSRSWDVFSRVSS